MNEFKEIGEIYVSKSGDDINSGLDPDFPKLTIKSGLSVLSTNENLVVGTGIYREEGISIGSKNIIGDGLVVINAVNANQSTCLNFLPSNQGGTISNIVFNEFLFNVNANNSFNQRGFFNKCVFIGGQNNHLLSRGSARIEYNSCTFLNSTLTITSLLGSPEPEFIPGNAFISGSIVINSSINCVSMPNSRIESCQITGSTTSGIEENIHNSIISSVLTGTISNVGENNEDPLWIGDISNLETVVYPNSPLLGGGLNGSNIGNVRTGSLQNEFSQEWGVSPISTGNTAFGANSELFITSGVSAIRESDIIDLGQIRNSPEVKINGLVDFLNNVPDNNNLTPLNPNHLTFEAQYAGQDLIFNGVWLPFRYNQRMTLDGSGKPNGAEGFDWLNEVDLQFRYIIVKNQITNNYTSG